MRSTFPTLLAALVLLALAAPLAAQEAPNGHVPTKPAAADDAISWERLAPEASGTLEPCCDNDGESEAPNKSFVTSVEMPSHALHPRDKVLAWKDRALHGDDQPAARELLDGDALPRKMLPAKMLQVARQFDGMNRLQSGHEGILTFPPDTMVAAGPASVLGASNVALRLTDRNGRDPQTRSLNDFFGISYPPLLFDPKVHYDRLSGRYFVVALSVDFEAERSFIHLAVSRGSNPAGFAVPGDWCSYRISGKVGRSWADYPGLGMNERWLGISVNNFNFSGNFRSVFLYAIDKNAVTRNAAACPAVGFQRFRAAQDGHGETAFTVQPAQHYSTTDLAGDPLFFVNASSTDFTSDKYTLWRLVDEGGAPALDRFPLTGSQLYSVPPDAPQAAGPAHDTGDLRIQQAAFRDGRLWAVHATACNFGPTPGESCVRVVGIDPSASGGRIAFEEIFGGGEGWFLWMPGIAVNAAGDVAVAFQRGRGNMGTGVGFAGLAAGANRFEVSQRLINGRCGLENVDDGGRNRSGDYVGIQADPLDADGFWIAGEYSGNVGRLGCEWRTRIGFVRF